MSFYRRIHLDSLATGLLSVVLFDSGAVNTWSIKYLPSGLVWVRVQNSIGLPELDCAPEPDIAWVVRRDYLAARPTPAEVLLVIEVAEL